MITKVQDKTITGGGVAKAGSRLSTLEKAMLRWAVVDPDDKVLDASIGSGMIAEYLRRNMQCEVCGVSDSMEDVRRARGRLQSCDIVYAAPGDIPWRSGAFDTVLFKLTGEEDALRRMLGEIKRVLKPGGQLILGVTCLPAPLGALAGMLAEDGSALRPYSRQKATALLSSLKLERLSWQRTGLSTGVMIGWKSTERAEAC